MCIGWIAGVRVENISMEEFSFKILKTSMEESFGKVMKSIKSENPCDTIKISIEKSKGGVH